MFEEGTTFGFIALLEKLFKKYPKFILCTVHGMQYLCLGSKAVTIRVQGITFKNKKSQGRLRADHETCEKILENGAGLPGRAPE